MKAITLVAASLLALAGCAVTQSKPAATASATSTEKLEREIMATNAVAHDERQYTDGPVTQVSYLHVEYGHFEEYVDWLNSTWKPTLEATKKAGLIIDYKVFRATPKSPDQPNIIFWITFKNAAAAMDKDVELEEVAKRVIGTTAVQNKARVARNDYRKRLGSEFIREIILK